MAEQRFSELVGGIYDAVIEPTLWTPAIDAIRRAFSFHIALMGVHKLPGGEAVVNVSTNVPPAYVTSVVNYGADIIELWGGPQVMSLIPVEEPVLQSPRLPPNWANPVVRNMLDTHDAIQRTEGRLGLTTVLVPTTGTGGGGRGATGDRSGDRAKHGEDA